MHRTIKKQNKRAYSASIALIILYFFALNTSFTVTQDSIDNNPVSPNTSSEHDMFTTTPVAPLAPVVPVAPVAPVEKKESDEMPQNITNNNNPIAQDNELTEWHNHLKKLLVKGAFWNGSQNVPTDDWKDKAFDLAKNSVIKNASLADELKTSFLTTINDKFLNIEKGTNLTAIASIINEFNKTIDESVSSVAAPINQDSSSPVKTTDTTPDDKKESQETPSTSDHPQEQPSSPEEPEPTAEEQEAAQKEKTENKLRYSWKECLDAIESEGLTEEEVPDMLQEIIPVIEKTVAAFPSEKDFLKNELLNSLMIRTEKALAQLSKEDTQRFLKPFENSEQQIAQQESGINEPFSEEKKPDSTNNVIKPQQPEEKKDQFVEPTQDSLSAQEPGSSQSITTVIESPVSYETTINAQKTAAENKIQAQRDRIQKSLALKMQKVAQEKAASQKGILATVAETVLGEWWTGPNLHEKNIETLQAEQIQDLDEIINDTLSEETKNIIKAAYQKFQSLLLNFNAKEYWNSQESRPNQLWIKKIKTPAFILIQHKIMGLEIIMNALEKTFETDDRMTIKNYKKTEAEFFAAIKKETEKQNSIYLEKQKEQQKILNAQQKEREQRELEERQKQEQIALQEKQAQEQAMKIVNDKTKAALELEKSQLEWNHLLQQISTSSPVTIDKNKDFTQQALEKTQFMLRLLSVLGLSNQKELVAQHITDFSKALLAQQQDPDNYINIHENMKLFNETIHEYASL